MEILILVGLLFVLFLFIGASANTQSGSYGYLTLPNGKVIEGRVTMYQENGRGMARIRIGGRTYTAPVTSIILVK